MMSQKTPLVTKVSKHQNLSWSKTKNPLVSKTLNIYANALNSCLCTSPARPFPSVNLPSRVLNLEGFCWQKGYRNLLASISYTKTYQKFLEALHLIAVVRKKGGSIYVIFDGDEYRPPSSFLDPQKKYRIKRVQAKGFFDPEGPLLLQGRNWRSKISRVKDTALDQQTKTLHDTHKKSSRLCFSRAPKPSPSLHKNKGQYENIRLSGEKWVGGTFSNFKQVSKSINLYKTLSRQFLEILESQTSPRYFVMAKKFHGNIFSSKKISNAFLPHEHSALWREALTKEGAKRGSSKACFTAGHGMQNLAQRVDPSQLSKQSSPGAFLDPKDRDLQEGPKPSDQAKKLGMLGMAGGGESSLDRINSLGQGLQSRVDSKHSSLSDSKAKKKSQLKSKNLPDLIIIENAEKYKNVIAEAETLKIPVVAFVESDILSNISIALPLNALKHYFLAFLLYIIYKMPSN